ncbi:hypothetical protein V12B01_12635 [Vibrio splendidus 12B01]|nr:hypothetical protein V12B01_12635 [Vibrio splendidus 12B01]
MRNTPHLHATADQSPRYPLDSEHKVLQW